MSPLQKLTFAQETAFWEYNTSLGYLLGTRGKQKDPEKAFRWNSCAARAGYHDAILAMGWFYANGIGVKANLGRARFWYERAARTNDPRAWFSLGQLAYNRKDFERAVTWFKKAARVHHPRALYYLGRLHLDGDRAAKNLPRAIALLQRSARLGNAFAARLLHSKRLKGAAGGAIKPRKSLAKA